MLKCPDCTQQFYEGPQSLSSIHHEHECECGAFLQWDQPVQNLRMIGPPQPCRHTNRNPQARVPLPG